MKRFALLLALLFLVECTAPRVDPSGTDGDANVVSPTGNEEITREKAIEIAQTVDSKINWRAAYEKEFEHEMNGTKRVRPVWVVQSMSPAPNTTLWIDAETEEILAIRQSEAPALAPVDRERALEMAKEVDSKATWQISFDEAFEYEFNGNRSIREVWVAQTLSPAANTTLWIDAKTGEILVLRQSEAPAPSTGK